MKRIKVNGHIPLDSVGGDHYLFDHDAIKANPVTVAHNVRIENGKLTFELDLTPELEMIIEGQRQQMFKLIQEIMEAEEREASEMSKSSYQRAIEWAAANPPTELDAQFMDVPYEVGSLIRFQRRLNDKGEEYWHCLTKKA